MSDDSQLPPPGDEALQAQLDDFWALLEDGEVDEALDFAHELLHDNPESGDCALALAAACYEAGSARDTLEAAQRAGELSPTDPLLQRWYIAAAHHYLWDFATARELCDELLREDEDFGEAWYLLAQACEMQGDEVGARRGYERAARVDPERFARPTRMQEEQFEQALERAREELPTRFREVLGELAVAWEDNPTEEMARAEAPGDDPLPPDLLGLFVGADRFQRSSFDIVDQPGLIFLFRKNLERVCPDRHTLVEEIQTTLWHELAHYLGFDEEQVADLGLE